MMSNFKGANIYVCNSAIIYTPSIRFDTYILSQQDRVYKKQ